MLLCVSKFKATAVNGIFSLNPTLDIQTKKYYHFLNTGCGAACLCKQQGWTKILLRNENHIQITGWST